MNAIQWLLFVEQAGGKASDGFRIMELQTTEVHERVLFLWQLQYGRESRRIYA
jgi:fructose-1,6-bisphosphatase